VLQGKTENGKLIIILKESMDSFNAVEAEKRIRELCAACPSDEIELDCNALRRVSSAGLRVMLRLRQDVEHTVLTNVHPDLYSLLDLTGITEMMEVRRAFRVLSTEACELIGEGSSGRVYRLAPDTIVKVYQNPDALSDIRRERELARLAFVAGVPTAIPYDVVRIEGGGYGAVYELLDAVSYAGLLKSGTMTVEEVAGMSVRLLREIHSREIHSELLPDMKKVAQDWAAFLEDELPRDAFEKLTRLIREVPEDDHLIHGDYHVKNVLVQNGESLLIDMDTLSRGHPVFELAGMYNAYVGFGLADPGEPGEFLGIPGEICLPFWRRSLELYLGTQDPQRVSEVEDRAGIIGLTRLIRREIRRRGREREDGRRMIAVCRSTLMSLLERTDTLVF